MADIKDDGYKYSVPHAEHEMFKRLKEALNKGEVTPETLPQDYQEHHRIVDPTSEDGRKFQKEMTEVLKFLVPEPEFSDFIAKHPVHFLLSDMKEMNGYIIPNDNQTIICLDKELFKQADNFNQLAYVVLHELTHLKMYDVFGEGRNSQVEEGICDARPLRKMSQLGLDMNEAKKFMAKLANKNEKPPAWMALIDAHPLPHFRVDMVETVLGGLRSMMGTEAAAELKEVKPMPEALAELTAKAEHHSYIDRESKQVGFDALPSVAQIDQLKEWLPGMQAIHTRRILDMVPLVRGIALDRNDPKHVKKASELANALLDQPLAANLLYHTLVTKLKNGQEAVHPKGDIKELAEEMEALIASRNTPEMKRHAKRIVEIYDSHPSRHISWKDKELPGFKLETRKHYKRALQDKDNFEVHMPWHKHAEAAYRGQDSALIRALWLCGVCDQRLIEVAGEGDLRWFQKNVSPSNTLSVPTDPTRSITLQEMPLDGFGGLIKIRLTNNEIGDEPYYRNYKKRSDEKLRKIEMDKIA